MYSPNPLNFGHCSAISADKLRWYPSRDRNTWGHNGCPFRLIVRKVQIQRQQEGERVVVFFHAVGHADGGAERGVAVAGAVGAGRFEGAVEFAQRPAVGLHDLAAQGVQGTGGFGHIVKLRPGEGVKDGVGGVTGKLAA